MQSDLSQAVGYPLKDLSVSWTAKDLLLYAIGIGAKKDDLPFVYERHHKFAAFPTYPVVLALKGNHTDVTNFQEIIKDEPVPGLPAFDPNRIVHGSQSIEIFAALPIDSGAGWKLRRTIIGIHENKSGIIVEHESLLLDADEVPHARMVSATFNIGAKTSGPFASRVSVGPKGKPIPHDRKPEWVVLETVPEEQAFVYRLSGDYNHIDPVIGTRAGFGGPILHGLASFGYAARAVVKEVGGNDPASLRTFGVRFTSPVKPGDLLETSMWDVGCGPLNTVEIAFQTRNMSTGKICLGGGVAYVRTPEKSKL